MGARDKEVEWEGRIVECEEVMSGRRVGRATAVDQTEPSRRQWGRRMLADRIWVMLNDTG